MVKRLLIFILLFSFYSSFLIGQNIGGIKQDNNEVNVYWLNTVPFYNMPDIKIGEYYTNGVEIRVPRDTITSISGSIRRVKLKKLKLISVQNIPNGLSYSPTIIDNADESFFRLQLKVYGRVASITTAKRIISFFIISNFLV